MSPFGRIAKRDDRPIVATLTEDSKLVSSIKKSLRGEFDANVKALESIDELANLKADALVVDARTANLADVFGAGRNDGSVAMVALVDRSDEATLRAAPRLNIGGVALLPFQKDNFLDAFRAAKRAAQGERESEEHRARVALAQEIVSDFLYHGRVESDGAIVIEWASDSIERALGFDPIGALDVEERAKIVHPDDAGAIMRQLQSASAGRASEAEFRLRDREGVYRVIKNYLKPIGAKGEGRFVGFGKDQTASRDLVSTMRTRLDSAIELGRVKDFAEALAVGARWIEDNSRVAGVVLHYQAPENPFVVSKGAREPYDVQAVARQIEELALKEIDGDPTTVAQNVLSGIGADERAVERFEFGGGCGAGVALVFVAPGSSITRDDRADVESALSAIGAAAERLCVEKERRQREERYRTLFEQSDHAMFVADKAGVLLDVNKRAEETLRETRVNLLGSSVFELAAPEERERNPISIDDASGDRAAAAELTAMRADGETFPARISLKALTDGGVLGVIRDVSEQKAFEEETRRRAFALDNVGDAIIVTNNDAAFTVVDWNKGAEIIYGWSKREAIGKSSVRLLRTELVSDELQRDLPYVNEDGVFHGDVIQRRRGGAPIRVESRVFSITDDDGETINIVNVNRDVTERRALERKRLFENEARWKFALEAGGDGVWDWNLPAQEFFLSPGALQLLGFSEEEINERGTINTIDWFDRVHPEEKREALAGLFKHLRRESEMYVSEHRVRKNDGDYIDVLVKGKVVSWTRREKPSRVVGVLMDVGDYKRIQKELSAQLKFQQTLLDAVPIPVYYRNRDGEYIGCNAAFERFSGKSREEILNNKVYRNDRRFQPRELDEAEDENATVETKFVGTSGEVRDVIFHRAPFLGNDGLAEGDIVAAIDVTETRRYEQRLADSEEKYRRLFEEALDAIFVAEEREGRVVYCNIAAERLLERERTEIIGETITALDAETGETRTIREALEGRDAANRDKPYEAIVTTKSGDKRVAQIKANVFELRGNRFIQAIVRDMTEQKRLERERNEAEATRMMEKTARLISMGTLVAGVAHEINQPLNALKVMVDGMLFLHKRNPDVPMSELADKLAFVSDQAERIDKIVNHMRELVQSQKRIEKEKTDVVECLHAARSLLNAQMKEHDVEFVERVAEPTGKIEGFPTQIEQVFLNLLGNAVQALKTHDAKEKRIEASVVERGDQIVVVVADSGPGVPKDHLDQIFDPFFTTKLEEKGMGLGLAITQNIVSAHGGSISVANKPEGGARFEIILPKAEEKRQTA